MTQKGVDYLRSSACKHRAMELGALDLEYALNEIVLQTSNKVIGQ